MKYILLIFIISVELFSSCALPEGRLKLFISSKKMSNVHSIMFLEQVRAELININFELMDEADVTIIHAHFEFIGYYGIDGFGDRLANYTITNPQNNKTINLEKRFDASTDFSILGSSDICGKKDILFTNQIAKQLRDEILYKQCEKFQSIFDKQIALEKRQSQQNSQQRALADAKEEKRRQALSKLAQEENYEKLKKVLKIKPEYRVLLDDRTKTMLIGSYTLGEMSKSLRSGISDNQMIYKLQSTSFTYSSSFTYKQKGYLQEAGFSHKLIDFLELHTQEIEIQREEERRLARLERQREREIKEAREDERRLARREREQQANASNDREMFGKILAIGMGAAIASNSSLDSAAQAEFMTNYSADVMNDDMSMNNTKQWKDKTVQASNKSYSNGTSSGTSEVDRNKKISSRCKQKSKSYNDGDGQSTSHCQHAIYDQCVADEMCTFYPDKCKALNSRVTTSCDILSKMGDTQCPVCN